ncbi:LAGLIDADG family homing endonuclease [Enterococcus casseliflavus]|uniref:LAGLIDADG family homing endonuclease n=2 Tax=Enterococcus TaxID=1350 RepID=UPI000A38A5B4|nr:LAGLIDADG family homing endonuclease [Enterococcus sp. 4E1_DIV0656]OTO09120.1 hypothetical protein A5882_003450 [Enterococcus sp. 4E1_DIV0656]
MSEIEDNISLHSTEMLKIMKDPVKWAKHHLSDPPRWYQEQILRHPHNRKVLRCGRRIGKCIEENQRILLADGRYETVKNLYDQRESFKVVSLGEKPKNVFTEVFEIEDNGMKPVYKVSTRRGNEIKLTENHPLLTVDGWVEVQDLNVGEFVATPKNLRVFGSNDQRSNNFVKLLAYLSTSCKASANILTIEIKNDEVLSDISRICGEEGLELIQKSQKLFYLIDRSKSNEVIQLFRESGGRIPSEVYQYTQLKLSIFLAAIYDSQGWSFAGETPEIGYGGRNKDFLLDLSHLLLRFGIKASMVNRIANKAPYIQMMIYKCSDIVTFYNEIAPEAIRNYKDVYLVAISKEDRPLLIPRGQYLENEVARKNIKLRKSSAKTIQEDKLLFLGEKYNSDILKEIAQSDIYYDQIVSIEPLGKKQTYDVFVPETQNLVVEDFYVHNTWTMIAHILWVAFTCNGGKNPNGSVCVVATPYDNQARLIFDELVKNIESNEILAQSIKSKTKNPYFIAFKNGSVIKLFTAGTKSGSEGGSLRGQRADWLYMDKTLSLHTVTYVDNLVNSVKPGKEIVKWFILRNTNLQTEFSTQILLITLYKL